MQQGTLVGSYGRAVQDAANNEGGAVNAFMGMGMMNMASGGVMGGAATGPFQNQGTTAGVQVDPFAKGGENTQAPQVAVEAKEAPAEGAKFCTNCGNQVDGKFCSKCGTEVK